MKSSDLSLADAATYNRVFKSLGSLNSCQVERPSSAIFSFNLIPNHAAGVLLVAPLSQLARQLPTTSSIDSIAL